MTRRSEPSTLHHLASTMNVPHSEVVRLETLTTLIQVTAGHRLIHQGAFGNEVFLILEGEVLVERDGRPLAVLTPGAVVGEQAVLLNEPRNATVTAATDGLVAVMNRREFSTMLEACPVLARHVLQDAVSRAASAA